MRPEGRFRAAAIRYASVGAGFQGPSGPPTVAEPATDGHGPAHGRVRTSPRTGAEKATDGAGGSGHANRSGPGSHPDLPFQDACSMSARDLPCVGHEAEFYTGTAFPFSYSVPTCDVPEQVSALMYLAESGLRTVRREGRALRHWWPTGRGYITGRRAGTRADGAAGRHLAAVPARTLARAAASGVALRWCQGRRLPPGRCGEDEPIATGLGGDHLHDVEGDELCPAR
jgi:hypothetical protein